MGELFRLSNQNTMTGQKGSGKTTVAVEYGFSYLAQGKTVFFNFPLYGAWWHAVARHQLGRKFEKTPPAKLKELCRDIRSRCFRFDDWEDLYPIRPFRGKGQNPEDQFLCVYDEASIRLNARTWSERSKASKEKHGSSVRETEFFSQGRKLGFTFLVISQSEGSLDNQYRQQAGYRVHLRNLGQQGFFGMRVPWNQFLAVYHWGETKSVLARRWFLYPKWVAGYYDSWELFDGAQHGGLRYQYDPDLPILGVTSPPISAGDGTAAGEGLRDGRSGVTAAGLPFALGERQVDTSRPIWERAVHVAPPETVMEHRGTPE